MSKFYHVIREGEQRWIRKPNNGGECCATQEDTVEELNRLIQERDALKDRVKKLEGYVHAMYAHTHKRYSEEQATGDSISIASTRAEFLAFRELKQIVDQSKEAKP